MLTKILMRHFFPTKKEIVDALATTDSVVCVPREEPEGVRPAESRKEVSIHLPAARDEAGVTFKGSTLPIKPKPRKIKYLWYKPPTFEKESRMTKEEIQRMDSAYRSVFGFERGGQKVKNPHAWEMETPTGRMSYTK